jgi:hypothetical protein
VFVVLRHSRNAEQLAGVEQFQCLKRQLPFLWLF